jgi:hypothetical protein
MPTNPKPATPSTSLRSSSLRSLRGLRWGRVALATSLLLGFVALSSPARGDEVDTLFDEGTTALEQGDFNAAYDKLSRAFAKRRSVDIAANLALAEVKLGKKREAAEHLAYGLANFPATGKPEAKERMQKQLAELKKGLCEFRVNTEEGSTVFVGEAPVGLSPLQTPLYLEPGVHKFRVERSGKMGEKSVTAAAGDSLTIKVELTVNVAPTATATGTGTGAPPPPPPEEKPLWPAILLGSLAGVGAGVGIGLTVAAFGARSAADPNEGDLPECASGFTAACQQASDDKLGGANGLFTGGMIGLGVAGASLVGLVVYLVLPSGSDEAQPDKTAPKASFTPVIAPGQAGGTFTLRF